MTKSTITNKGAGKAEICLYDEIDAFFGVGAKEFNRQLTALGDVKEITLRINSPGGSVWEGMAVLAMLNAHKAKIITRVEGLAASMASVVAMAGDEIEMPENAFIMIHNPADIAWGDADEIRKTADVLDSVKEAIVNIYAKRTGRPEKEISAWMDDETWMDGPTCKDRGFCTSVMPAITIAASLKPAHFSKTPAGFVLPAPISASPPSPKGKDMPTETDLNQKPVAATLKQLRAACPGADEKFLVAQLEADATIEQASTAWMTAQQAKIADLETKVAAGKKPGVTPTKPVDKKKGKKKDEEEDEDKAPCDEDEEDPKDLDDMSPRDIKDAFEKKVSSYMSDRAKMGRPASRRDAVIIMANRDPKLHQAWMMACNPSMQGQRLVAEKYDALPRPKRA